MASPNYAALKAQIALPQYAGMTTDQLEAALQSPVSVPVDVPVGSVEGYLRTNMLLGGMQRFVASPPTGAPAALVEGLTELLGLILSPHVETVQMTNPAVSTAVAAVLGGAVAAGLMSAQNETDLLAMGSVSLTAAEQCGLLPGVHDITQELAAAAIWPGVSG
jgi:hypothetical protein